jgi:hypothetical protein
MEEDEDRRREDKERRRIRRIVEGIRSEEG